MGTGGIFSPDKPPSEAGGTDGTPEPLDPDAPPGDDLEPLDSLEHPTDDGQSADDHERTLSLIKHATTDPRIAALIRRPRPGAGSKPKPPV